MLINTCSVTNMADRKSRQMLHRAKKAESGCHGGGGGLLCTDSRKLSCEEDAAIDIIDRK